MPKLRSTYDGRLIYKTSYEESNVFLRYDSLAKLQDRFFINQPAIFLEKNQHFLSLYRKLILRYT